MCILTLRKRRSFVRFLASLVPSFLWEYFLPVSPRMCISSNLIHKISTMTQNNSQSDESNTSFCSFKQNFFNRNPQHILNSTPKRITDNEADKLKALQEELEEVKKIVAKLIKKQSEQSSGYGTLGNPSEQLQKSFNLPITTSAPPPPPPLPNFSLTSINSPLKIKNKKPALHQPQPGFPFGKDLLKDLKKVQLKKVEKSPGGGPLKKKKPNETMNDPGDFLAAVLKKRFGYVQNSPDSSLEPNSLNAENSSGSVTVNNSYEIEKNRKITVV